MENVTLFALKSLTEKKAKTLKLAPGRYNVDTVVKLRIKGSVEKLEDTSRTPTVEIPLLATLALVLEKSGCTREASKRMLVEAMQEAIASHEKGAEHIAERINDIDSAMAHVRDIIGELPKTPVSGATKVTATYEIVP